MAANGISTLSLKSDRQKAKLNLAQAKRQQTTVTINGNVVPNNGYRVNNVVNWSDLTLITETNIFGQNAYVSGNSTQVQEEYIINTTANARPWIP